MIGPLYLSSFDRRTKIQNCGFSGHKLCLYLLLNLIIWTRIPYGARELAQEATGLSRPRFTRLQEVHGTTWLFFCTCTMHVFFFFNLYMNDVKFLFVYAHEFFLNLYMYSVEFILYERIVYIFSLMRIFSPISICTRFLYFYTYNVDFF